MPIGSATALGYCPSGPLPAPASCYSLVLAGAVCAACSGYDVANASVITLPGGGGAALSGVGALVNTSFVIRLVALRERGLRFRAFTATAAVVRRWASCDCGGADPSACGARFSVTLDGAATPAWSSTVAVAVPLRLDVSAVSELKLTTTDVAPAEWRPGDIPFGGGPPPGVAQLPQRAHVCNGAAWALAQLV